MSLQHQSNRLSLRNKAFEIILKRSFSKGQFQLSSGEESNYYLDMKYSMLDPEGINALSRLVLERVKDAEVDYIGGLEMGAVPLIGPIAMLSNEQTRQLPGFFVRKEIKNHGTMKLIEGVQEGELKGKRVVILDDVTTTGGSAMIAVRAVQEAGANVILVLSVVDRLEGATEFFQKAGIPFTSLFTADEFMAVG